jgi:hypothetical protein
MDAGKLGGWFESVFRGGSEVGILQGRRLVGFRVFPCLPGGDEVAVLGSRNMRLSKVSITATRKI